MKESIASAVSKLSIKKKKDKDSPAVERIRTHRSQFDCISFSEFKIEYSLKEQAEKAPKWTKDEPINEPFNGEKLIDTEIERLVADTTRHANHLIVERNNEIDKWFDDVSIAMSEASLTESRFKQYSKLVWSDGGLERQSDRVRYHDAKDTYDSFRIKNKLSRPADIPTTANKMLKILILLSIIIFEAILNMQLFSTNLEGGLLAGFTYAIMLASINAAVAFCFGRFILPYKNHVYSLKYISGYISLLLWVCLETILAFGISHYRDSLQIVEEDLAAVKALELMINNFFELSDLHSWILWIATWLFGIVALIDGYHMQDIYPGYTSEQKKYDQELEKWQDIIFDAREKLEQEKETAISSLDIQLRKAEKGLQDIERAINSKENTIDSYNAFVKHVITLRDSCIAYYRNKRGDYLTPLSVKHHLEFSSINPQSTIEENRLALKEKEDEFNQIKFQADILKEKIISSYEKASETLKLDEE